MHELTDRALDAATSSGAGYADARVVLRRSQNVSTKNGSVDSVSDYETEGLGVRVGIGDSPDAFPGASNRELVERVVDMARARGLEPASPREVRTALGLRERSVIDTGSGRQDDRHGRQEDQGQVHREARQGR